MASSVRTRFAPSPTGALHLGGARTALFNYLLARQTGGEFLLRLEDTDAARSQTAFADSILNGLQWLGLEWDGEVVHQSQRREQHCAAADMLLQQGHAYRCYCTPEELAAMRERARAEGKPIRYDGRCRDVPLRKGVPFALRLKCQEGKGCSILDAVQGEVRVENDALDDFILLRSDGTPTYMLAVVVDDKEMGITHIVRGVDHLTNALRQSQIYQAMGWDEPLYAHVPLIHGADGAKLSKRHGGLTIEEYQAQGFLPDAMCNYLARLGWAHGDDEIFSMAALKELFSLKAVGKSPARFDAAKLDNLNAHYLREMDEEKLARETMPLLAEKLGLAELPHPTAKRLLDALPYLKPRATNLQQLAEQSLFLGEVRPALDAAAKKIANPKLAAALAEWLEKIEWKREVLKESMHQFAETGGHKMRDVAQPARAALTGRATSPGIYDVLYLLGKTDSLARLRQA